MVTGSPEVPKPLRSVPEVPNTHGNKACISPLSFKNWTSASHVGLIASGEKRAKTPGLRQPCCFVGVQRTLPSYAGHRRSRAYAMSKDTAPRLRLPSDLAIPTRATTYKKVAAAGVYGALSPSQYTQRL